MGKCSVPNCPGIKAGKYKRISFHRLPADLSRRKKWMIAFRQIKWSPPKESYICSNHFKPSDYLQLSTGKLLTDAVPSVFNNRTLKSEKVDVPKGQIQKTMCRLCGESFPVSEMITDEKTCFDVFSKLNELLAELVSLDENLSKTICSKCVENVNSSYNVIVNIVNTQVKLNDQLKTQRKLQRSIMGNDFEDDINDNESLENVVISDDTEVKRNDLSKEEQIVRKLIKAYKLTNSVENPMYSARAALEMAQQLLSGHDDEDDEAIFYNGARITKPTKRKVCDIQSFCQMRVGKWQRYVCSVCGRLMVSRFAYIRHRGTHIIQPPIEKRPRRVAKRSSARPGTCDICDRRIADVATHRAYHTLLRMEAANPQVRQLLQMEEGK